MCFKPGFRTIRPVLLAPLFLACLLLGCELLGQQGTVELEVYPERTSRGTVNPESRTFDEGTRATILARPFDDRGWQFSEWKGDISSTENPHTFKITRDTEAIAVFELKQYTLTILIEGQGRVLHKHSSNTGTGSEEPGPVYQHGSNVHLTAIPDEGWEFDMWYGENFGFNRPANPETMGMWKDQTLTARFRQVN